MFQKEVLGLEEATKAVQTMLRKVTEEGQPPVSVAVVDDRGDLIQFARMDGASFSSVRMALTKAYTSAKMRRDTTGFRKLLEKDGFDKSDFTDDMLTTIGGGVVIPLKGGKPSRYQACLGGIGVAGLPSPDKDEALARTGQEAISG